MTTISLEGISTLGGNETRALAYIKVIYNNNEYNWQVYIPENTSLDEYFSYATPIIEREIDQKEAEWAALDPKTRTIEDPLTGQTYTVPIEKNEIVKPDIPDYYAKRRNAYPHLSDQLDALWKGPSSSSYSQIENAIVSVKNTYPKSFKTQQEYEQELIENIVGETQRRLDNFARTRNYDGILSACTYATSTIQKFQIEGQYCVDARDATWAALYQILADVQANLRPPPTSFADIEADLPALVWPPTL